GRDQHDAGSVVRSRRGAASAPASPNGPAVASRAFLPSRRCHQRVVLEVVAVPMHGAVDWQELDLLIVAVPLPLLYFDRGLICRYAAPSGPHLLGRSIPELLGAPVHTVFPPELEMARRVEAVQRTQTAWHGERIAYPGGHGGASDSSEAWPAGVWNVNLRP